MGNWAQFYQDPMRTCVKCTKGSFYLRIRIWGIHPLTPILLWLSFSPGVLNPLLYQVSLCYSRASPKIQKPRGRRAERHGQWSCQQTAVCLAQHRGWTQGWAEGTQGEVTEASGTQASLKTLHTQRQARLPQLNLYNKKQSWPTLGKLVTVPKNMIHS